MAPFSSSEFSAPSRTRCSYKSATALVCTCNIVAILYVLQLFLSPVYLFSTTSSPSITSLNPNPNLRFKASRYSQAQLRRIKEAVEVWRAAEPVELVKRVREIRVESAQSSLKDEQVQYLKQTAIANLTARLKELRAAGNESQMQQELEDWRRKKLEEIMEQETKSKNCSSPQEARVAAARSEGMKYILEAGWNSLLEDIGWSKPDPPDIHVESGELEETEDNIIPGRTVPPECHAEPHTDYDGSAVKWGLNFHVESAADCCQACLDQAKTVKPGQMICNIWVFCPQEAGCYSPDIYEHKHQECWLKQASQPRLNFKGKYAPDYRKSHPTAPVVVPWVSGVVSSS